VTHTTKKIPPICLSLDSIFFHADNFDAMSCHSKSIILLQTITNLQIHNISMISTTSAIHHILALGGVDSSIIIGSSDTKSSLLDQRPATSANDSIAMEEDDDIQQQPHATSATKQTTQTTSPHNDTVHVAAHQDTYIPPAY